MGTQFYRAIALGILSTSLTLHGAHATSSNSFGIQANLTALGTTYVLGPVAPAGDTKSGAYSKTTALKWFQQSLPLGSTITPIVANTTATTTPPANITTGAGSNTVYTVGLLLGTFEIANAPILQVSAGPLKSHAQSAGFGIDTQSAQADASVKKLTVMLIVNTPVVTNAAVAPLPYLLITAEAVESSAALNQVFPQTAVTSTSASFSGLEITGSLLGGKKIHFGGTTPNNAVIFQNASVKVTLNTQALSGAINCAKSCSFSPNAVTGNALDISLTNADINGVKVSGDILIAQTQAGP